MVRFSALGKDFSDRQFRADKLRKGAVNTPLVIPSIRNMKYRTGYQTRERIPSSCNLMFTGSVAYKGQTLSSASSIFAGPAASSQAAMFFSNGSRLSTPDFRFCRFTGSPGKNPRSLINMSPASPYYLPA
jgi:hypothetical protein